MPLASLVARRAQEIPGKRREQRKYGEVLGAAGQLETETEQQRQLLDTPIAMENPVSRYIEYVDRFNRNIKVLTLDLGSRYPADSTVYHAKRRIITAIGISPLFVVDEAGPYLYKYRNEIYALEKQGEGAEAAERNFMTNTYDEELQNAKDKELAGMSAYIINLAKSTIVHLDPAKKQEYKKLVIDLLDDYVDYLTARYPAK